MKLKDYEVPQEIIDAAIRWMRSKAYFTAGDLDAEFLRLGVPECIPGSPCIAPPGWRATNKLIKQEEAAGNILKVKRNVWRAVAQAQGGQP